MRTPFYAAVESLERRETPSAGLHALTASVHHVYALNGSGQGTVTSFTLTPQIAVTANVQGSASRLGAFQGTVHATGVGTSHQASGTVVIRNASGSEVDMTLSGSFKTGKSGSDTGTFWFVITGGTGLAAGSTGSGSLTGSLNPTTGAFKFSFNGKIRV